MFKSKPQNTHNSWMPKLGDIVKIEGYAFKVIAFPVCDNVLPYSRGIHTVWIERLHDRHVMRVSAFYLDGRDVA